MSDNFIRTFNRPFVIMNDSRVLAASATLQSPNVRVTGYRYLTVLFSAPVAATAAAGFPRVRQSQDGGTTFDTIDVIPLDASQATPMWRFANPGLQILEGYVSIEFKDGGGGASPLRSIVFALPA